MSDKMDTAVREARSAYLREWRKKNPNKTKEYANRYWEKRAMLEQKQKEMVKDGSNKTVSDH